MLNSNKYKVSIRKNLWKNFPLMLFITQSFKMTHIIRCLKMSVENWRIQKNGRRKKKERLSIFSFAKERWIKHIWKVKVPRLNLNCRNACIKLKMFCVFRQRRKSSSKDQFKTNFFNLALMYNICTYNGSCMELLLALFYRKM